MKSTSTKTIGAIRVGLAAAMIGQTVTLLASSKVCAQGVVKGVMIEGGSPKVVVNGYGYDLNQVLTVQPTLMA